MFSRNVIILIIMVACAGCTYVPVKTKPAETPPASPNLIMLMGRYEELRGNWSRALAYYSEVKDPYATLAQARIYFITNDSDNAMAMLQKVLDEGTYTGEALEMRTKIHARNSNWQKAIKDTEVLIKKYPDNSQLKLFLANLKIITGDFKDSRAVLQGLIGTGDDSIIYYTIAKTCMGERNFKCVKDNLKKAIESRQDFTPAYIELAKTYNLLGEPAEALKVYQKLLDIDPLSSDAHLALVDHFIQQKNYREAVSHLKSFLETFPDSILLRKLIVLELQEGMYDEIGRAHV
jgi:tetratricopeptide (TPR) repeat protein